MIIKSGAVRRVASVLLLVCLASLGASSGQEQEDEQSQAPQEEAQPQSQLPQEGELQIQAEEDPLNQVQQEEDQQDQAQVTYVTASSIYINAGREDGLREGDQVEVMRAGASFAVLRVVHLSSHKASCESVGGAGVPDVGDAVRFTAHAVEPLTSVATGGNVKKKGRRRNKLREAGLRGRVGLRYQLVRDRTDNAGQYSSPSLDLRLDGYNVWGSPVDLSVDVRSRRTYRTQVGIEARRDSRTRVYRMAVAVHDQKSRYRVTIGRQYSPSLATVSIFDGLLFDVNTPRWSTGLFSGTQPDPIDFGVSTQIREHGAFVQVHNRPRTARHWAVTTGAIGSYHKGGIVEETGLDQEGGINREFIYLQATFAGPRLSTHVAQEVDYNRGWKEDAGENQFSNSSTFLSIRYRLVAKWEMHGGYDNRRNIRLYRDLITPETDFDDAYRQGTWVGTSLGFGRHFSSSLDARSTSGGVSGDAEAQTLTMRVFGLTRRQLSFRGRSTFYANTRLDGRLYSLGAGMAIGSRYHFELTGGLREETGVEDPFFDNRFTWVALEQDVRLGRRWYLLLTAERDEGETESNDQFYTSITYRF